MCRMAAIKSRNPLAPAQTLRMMLAMQKGHDNSGFAMVMQDLGGVFEEHKDLPLLSMACIPTGLEIAESFLESRGFSLEFDYQPEGKFSSTMNFERMPLYVFRNYKYPQGYLESTWAEKKALLVETHLSLRQLLAREDQGYVYSFWPDVLTLKEIGDPRDIGSFFQLWDEDHALKARVISSQCRQNTNYKIVRYAAHPFFLDGYTLMGNGENTFYQKNKDFQQGKHPGYIGFESDTQCFLYTLHYVVEQLGWPLSYYKHVVTPLPFDEIAKRPDAPVLKRIRQSCQHLEMNGPNTVVFVLPNNQMGIVADAKKLRPMVVGRDDELVAIASEVSGVNMIIPDRDYSKDVYPGEREMVVIDNNLEVQQWVQ
jgi:glutamate synthase domain-containing protein 1